MTTRYGVWHGGNGYGMGHDWTLELEEWSSLASVKRSLIRRYRGSDYEKPVSIDDDGVITHHTDRWAVFPSVNREECYIDLFDIESGEPYLRLTLGPRLGVRVENF